VGNVITALATYLFGVLWRTEIGWAIDAVVEGWNLLGFLGRRVVWPVCWGVLIPLMVPIKLIWHQYIEFILKRARVLHHTFF